MISKETSAGITQKQNSSHYMGYNFKISFLEFAYSIVPYFVMFYYASDQRQLCLVNGLS